MEPEKIKFIDRMVADSRCVALNHTAGLSLPQQVQMCFFGLTHLLDETDAYKHLTMEICHKRRDLLWKGMRHPRCRRRIRCARGTTSSSTSKCGRSSMYGQEFFDYLSANYEPVDFLFRVAEKSSVVLMDGGGFGGPKWSIRVSLANLNDEDYAQIGNFMRKSAEEYANAWKAGQEVASGVRAGRACSKIARSCALIGRLRRSPEGSLRR